MGRTASSNAESFPTKSEREVCWGARDKYWECLDVNNEEDKTCVKLRKEFEKSCPAVWVKHFDRKRRYVKFKDEMDKENWTSQSDAFFSK